MIPLSAHLFSHWSIPLKPNAQKYKKYVRHKIEGMYTVQYFSNDIYCPFFPMSKLISIITFCGFCFRQLSLSMLLPTALVRVYASVCCETISYPIPCLGTLFNCFFVFQRCLHSLRLQNAVSIIRLLKFKTYDSSSTDLGLSNVTILRPI